MLVKITILQFLKKELIKLVKIKVSYEKPQVKTARTPLLSRAKVKEKVRSRYNIIYVAIPSPQDTV